MKFSNHGFEQLGSFRFHFSLVSLYKNENGSRCALISTQKWYFLFKVYWHFNWTKIDILLCVNYRYKICFFFSPTTPCPTLVICYIVCFIFVYAGVQHPFIFRVFKVCYVNDSISRNRFTNLCIQVHSWYNRQQREMF